MSRFTWLYNPEHGVGTKGKRSPFVPPGVEEWEFNRAIAARVERLCALEYIDFINVNPEPESLSLKARCDFVNAVQKSRKNCILVTCSANADGDGADWTDANGAAVFCYKRGITAEKYAKEFLDKIVMCTDFHSRGVKTAGYAILKNTTPVAILIEHGFMTNKKEAKLLASPTMRDVFAYAHLEAIQVIEENG
jgi:N-acetylmuramoyl-L-alanine amidase